MNNQQAISSSIIDYGIDTGACSAAMATTVNKTQLAPGV